MDQEKVRRLFESEFRDPKEFDAEKGIDMFATSTARFYKKLISEGLPEQLAASLAENFYRDLMAWTQSAQAMKQLTELISRD